MMSGSEYLRGYSEGHDDGYRAGLQAAREKFDRDGGRVVPVAEVRIDDGRLEEIAHRAVRDSGLCDREGLLALADSLDEARGGEDQCGRFLGLGSCRPDACRAAYGDVDCVDTVAQAVASRIRRLCGCSV